MYALLENDASFFNGTRLLCIEIGGRNHRDGYSNITLITEEMGKRMSLLPFGWNNPLR